MRNDHMSICLLSLRGSTGHCVPGPLPRRANPKKQPTVMSKLTTFHMDCQWELPKPSRPLMVGYFKVSSPNCQTCTPAKQTLKELYMTQLRGHTPQRCARSPNSQEFSPRLKMLLHPKIVCTQRNSAEKLRNGQTWITKSWKKVENHL